LLSIVPIKYVLFEQFNGKPLLLFCLKLILPGTLFAGIVGCLFKGFISWYSEIRFKEQLVQKNLQSELALLKAQINPHFLFNTINNIDVLIEKEPKAASLYLKQLSDIMRFMLNDAPSEYIPLSKELEYIKKYIELQKIRTSNDKYVNLNIIGASEKLMVAPAIFIPFIENAFKHSTNKKIENAINITIEIIGNDLSFRCINFFDNSNTFEQEKSGLGIDLIKQRLQLLYKDQHELNIIKTDNRFEVTLKINTK
jgi:LytS/YehU family sensor histidine kinase